MKKLGFGLMRLPMKDGAIDIEQVKKMVDLFIEKGFTYFDTAWMYCGFNSEPAVKTALVERHPRDSFTLATKLNAAFFDSFEGRDEIFNAQLDKTGAGYFDYYLLHGIDDGNYEKFVKFDCFNWLQQKKAAGLVRHAGFSYHGTAKLLDAILTDHPETEFVQLQLNYLDWDSQWIQSGACYEVATKHGVPVVVMEPVKGGTLARVPADVEKMMRDHAPDMSPASWAIRYVASLPNVMMVLSGMSNIEQMEDNLGYMENFQPLSDEEKALVVKAGEMINAQIAIPCTGCSYCVDGCPQKIAIPQYFSLYNEDMREHLEEKGWTVNFSNYAHLTEKRGAARDCVECGQCEGICPQHLPIIEHLKAVSKHYDR